MKLNKLLTRFVRRAIETVDSWDGSPSNYASTEAYCKACLIDVNPKGEAKKQSLCMLPAKAPGSNSLADKAIFAIAGGRGLSAVKKPSDVDQGTWDAAVSKAAKTVVQAYKDMEKDPPAKMMDMAGMSRAIAVDQVFAQLQAAIYEGMMTWGGESMGYLVTVYIDNGELYALFGRDGLFTRAQLTIEDNDTVTVGQPETVTQEFVPVQRSSVTVQRMENGDYRIFMLAATAIINRVGQIDSTALFDDMIQRANEYDVWPLIDFFHLGEEVEGLDFGQADFLARDGVCYLASAKLDGSHPLTAPMVRSLQTQPAYWGCSIEYYPAPDSVDYIDVDGIEVPVFSKGLNTRITILPEAEAASWSTNIGCLGMERRNMNEKQKAALIALIGEDEFNRRMKDVEGVNGKVQSRKLIFRTAEAVPAEGTADTPAAETPAAEDKSVAGNTAEPKTDNKVEASATEEVAGTIEGTGEIAIDDDLVEQIAGQVSDSAQFTAMFEAVTGKVSELMAKLDEVLGKLTPMEQAVARSQDRLKALEEETGIQAEVRAQDKPRKFSDPKLRMVYRPSQQRAVVGQEDDGGPDGDAIANATLASLPSFPSINGVK